MKTPFSLLLFLLICQHSMASAQQKATPETFVAVTEHETYALYDRMIDSLRISNRYIVSNPASGDYFGIGYFDELDSRDTIMKFEHSSVIEGQKRYYNSYISNRQPIAFYGRFMDYLKKAELRESYFLKEDITKQIFYIRLLLIKRYESMELSLDESAEALQLMERATLWMINGRHSLGITVNYPYVTDSIRQALIHAIDHPFYPEEYLEYYMDYKREHEPFIAVDTVDVPDKIKKKLQEIWGDTAAGRLTDEEAFYYSHTYRWFYYAMLGKEWGGLSAEEAYWEEKRRDFKETGYLNINAIAEYAHRTQDQMIIEHLKRFKEKHPDYPLMYF